MLQTGQTLNNRYRIVTQIGQGGFGAVYRAWDVNLNIPCAVKENLDTSPEAQRQFQVEASLLSRLRHLNLPRVTDHFFIPFQGQYLVMDFVEGKNLGKLLEERGRPFHETEIAPWLGQICSALGYLHSLNPPIIHRDLKPQNLILTPEGQVMVVDFGISKVYDPQKATSTGGRGATPGYSPPEQYGQGRTDARSDIYALGATVYTLLTGKVLPDAIDRLIQQMPLTPPRQFNQAVSAQLEQVVIQAVALQATNRFATMADFRAALAPRRPPQPPPLRQQAQLAPAPKPPPLRQQAQPPPAPKLVVVTQRLFEPEMVFIPAGEFLMGSNEYNDEKPIHRVYLGNYYIGKYPVTNAQYLAFVQATNYRLPDHWGNGKPPAGKEEHPVVNVSWQDGVAYCQWLRQITGKGYRLPTEAEWEKAARGTDGRRYPWGDQPPTRQRCNFNGNEKETTPVGRYSPVGDSPYDCADMAGNVWEWVADWYDSGYYATSPGANPIGPSSGNRKLLRGGVWDSNDDYTRAANRFNYDPTYRLNYVGFRCAQE